MLAGVAALSILVLAASWVPELHVMPAAPRDGAAMVHQGVHLINLVWQLTAGWDWERLRLAATVWVAVTGLGLWTTSKLPIPITSASAAVALMGLVVLQYGAVGGGQPIWAIEHLVVHLMSLAGFMNADIDAFRHFARGNFAAHAPFRSISLQSQGLLGTIAFVLAVGISFVFGPSSATAESRS